MKKPRRPRDPLGRPLPWGTATQLPMEDFDELGIEENHRLATAYFDEANFFPAHEAWEAAWKEAKGTYEEELFKGLAQLGAGYVHYRRGNAHGAKTLLRRAASRIERGPERWRGLDLPRLGRIAEGHADAIERAQRAGRDLPPIELPTAGRPA